MNEPARIESDAVAREVEMLATKRRLKTAAVIAAAALLFGGGIALGMSRGGSGFAANLAGAFRSAFGSGTAVEIPLRSGESESATPGDAGGAPSPAGALAACEPGDEEPVEDGSVVISEVAWMGSPAGANHEWVELANISSVTVDVSGWQVYDRGRKIQIALPAGTIIAPNGFLVMTRDGAALDSAGVPAVSYRGALNNSNEEVLLFDSACALADAVYADPAWPAGDNSSKRTMELDLATRMWHTSAVAGGTPGRRNSPGVALLSAAIPSPPVVPNPPPLIAGASTSDASTPRASEPPSPTVNIRAENPPLCPQDNLPAPTFSLLINEVAWAGTGPGRTSDEWIELRNPSGAPVPLSGWQIVNGSRTLRVAFPSSSAIAPRGFFLLERGEGAVPWVAADVVFSGAIKNNDEALRLFDPDCRLVDEVVVAAAWPAGTGAPDYRSAERSDDRTWHTYNWSPINGIFGTPRMVNSEPAPDPAPIGGAAGGTGGGSGGASEAGVDATSTATSSGERVLISEVMAGSEGAPSNEFVEIYNAGDSSADLTGWCMKKRTSTGSESTLVSAARLDSRTVAPGGYLLFANDSGYLGITVPDVRWPSSYTLAYSSNAVVLYRGCAEKEDEAAWTEIPAGQSIVRDSWEGAVFSASTAPTPRNSSGN